MSSEQLRKHILASYFLLRVGMALIGFLFPLILWIGGLFVNFDLQPAMSLYYHTPMRNIFVGILCALGAFLYLYKGYDYKENIGLNFAGIFAVGIALLPTSPKELILRPEVDPGCDPFFSPLHGICAILFFLSIAFVSIFTHDASLKENSSSSKRKFYGRLYNILGILMILLPLSSAYLMSMTKYRIIAIQIGAIWTFSTYWVLKTFEFTSSQLDKKIVNNLN